MADGTARQCHGHSDCRARLGLGRRIRLVRTTADVPNSNQRDTNGDGYGNLCDADFDNNGFVNFNDLTLFKQKFTTTDADANLDGIGIVNFADLAIFKSLFGKPPGPSG